MSIARQIENIPGNLYDKYKTPNPIARLMMRNFLRAFDELVALTDATKIYEAGCGEGHLSCRLLHQGLSVHGSDLELIVVDEANQMSNGMGYGERFVVRSLYDLVPAEAGAQLVICCEVLEHLPDPDAALRVLAALADPFLLVSVPREPLWRTLNIARGSYLTSLGNTPGHIQHWSSRAFEQLLRRHVEIVETRHPIPWAMALCKRR